MTLLGRYGISCKYLNVYPKFLLGYFPVSALIQ
jgi:hypothetical protein